MSRGEPGDASRFDDFDEPPRKPLGGFFRGAELSRLMVLLALMVAGWFLVWAYLRHGEPPAEDPEPAPRAAPPEVAADDSPSFESVTDRTPLSLRDMAAYDLLLKRARGKTPADLARRGRRDIYFTDLWERPGRYRGVPIHLLGTARRIISYESKLSPTGRLYEAWISTHESQGYPYVGIFEDLPRGMPVGPDVSERVVFNGYFLKQMRYLSGRDVQRAAPVLIGRIGWTPGRAARRVDPTVWMAAIVGVLFVISLFRWISGLRRSLARGPQASSLGRRPTEEIAPEDLSRWVDSVRADEGEPGAAPEDRRD